jgi:potassium efflux system protein
MGLEDRALQGIQMAFVQQQPQTQFSGRRIFAAALLLLMLFWSKGFAQTEAEGGGPPLAAPAASDMPTVEQLRGAINTLEGTTEATTPDRSKALEAYHLALSRLLDAQHYAELAKQYKQAMASAPAATARLRDTLEKGAKPTAPAVDPHAGLEALNQQLATAQAQLSALQSQRTELDQQITTLHARPESAQKELAEARSKLTEIQQALQALPSALPSAWLAKADRAVLLARWSARKNQVTMLELDLQSVDARLALLNAQRDDLDRHIAAIQAQVTALLSVINQKRLSEASQVAEQVEQSAQQAAWGPAIVRQVADGNAALSQQLTALAERIQLATTEQATLNQQLAQLESSYHEAQQQLAIIGLSNALGPVLHGERRRLPDPQQYRDVARKRRKRLETARIQQFQITEEWRKLGDLDAFIDRFMSQHVPAGIPPEQHQAVAADLRKLFTQRQQLLSKLRSSYASYISLLVALHQGQQQFRERASKYATLLDENLLWLVSASPVSLPWLRALPASFVQLGSPSQWLNVARHLLLSMRQTPLLASLVLLVWACGLLWRKRCYQRLSVAGERVGAMVLHGFRPTLEALLVTVALALPWPLLLGWMGWALQAASNSQAFVRAAGIGCFSVAVLLAVMNTLIVLGHDQGLMAAHFHWRESARRLFRHHLVWLRVVAVLVVFLVTMTEALNQEMFRDTVGRLAFVLGSLALSVFVWRVFRPRTGLQASLLAGPRGTKWHTCYFVGYLLITIAPLVLAVLALLGYYYTAVQLEIRVVTSGLVAMGAVIVVNLVIRWLNVAERRSASLRARSRREAMQAARATKEAAASAGEGVPESLEVPEIDLRTMSENARRLLYLIVGVGVGVGFWLIWADLLPALHLLNDVVLWHQSAGAGEQEAVYAITLGHLLLAIGLSGLTLTLARNLPGALDIAVLQRLTMEPGDRYALTSITRYIIMTIGLFVVLKFIGIGWGQVQWLVAAMGIGLGFGLQEIFANFVSGLILLIERPIRVGDTVSVGTFSGTVSRIRIRSTTITDWDRKEVLVPNKTFLTDTLVNWTLSDPITRLIITVGVAYGSDPALVHRVLLETSEANPLVLKEPAPVVLFMEFGDSALNFEVRVFVRKLTDRFPLTHELHMAIMRAFREHSIEIPFPQRDIHVRYAEPAGIPATAEAASATNSRTSKTLPATPDREP